MQNTHDVRKGFLEYFKKHDHAHIASSSVVPHDDPTLLFINAGMNQFKDVFLGKATRDYSRATTSQKCIRVGGKHNDLENVGHTTRHLTFFEMLGNFSFGDYFKDKAIQYAWELATQVFKFDANKVWVSVFRDDDEAYELWKKHLPENRIVRLDEKSNFWAMGDTGPCGPCSELLYDRGESYSKASNPAEDESGERFLEFWNLVFMQYNRKQDGTMSPLPKPSIDTGAGLERVMSLIQGKESVFETDLFLELISAIETISLVTYNPQDEARAAAFRVIADHLRCLAFAISDGAQPSNVERGYVLRKVLRRAVRYGKMLGLEKPFLAKLMPKLVSVMGSDYKELVIAKDKISEILTLEEEAFFRTLRRGGNILNQIIESSKKSHEISGDDAFKLKDTYGLPIEEVQLIAKDNGLHVDMDGFSKLEKEAKEKSKLAQKVVQQEVKENVFQDFVKEHGECAFIREPKGSGKVIGLINNGHFVDTISEGDDAQVILDKTTFYAEMGGQVGDSGELTHDTSCFSVSTTNSPFKGVICHHGKLTSGHIKLGDVVETQVDSARRQKIANNHTATHLLHWALHQVLGEHVKQAGSIVEPGRLRFDFNHHKALTNEEMRAIEQMVNEKIRHNNPVKAYELAYEDAQKRHDIVQFFGEKYGKVVRVIDIDYSKELCGGTHTSNTGNIGYFRILKESSIASGVRRIEAATGQEAEHYVYDIQNTLGLVAEHLKTPQNKLLERVEKLNHEMKALEDELKELQKMRLSQIASGLTFKTNKSGVSYCVHAVDVGPADLKGLMDALAEKSPQSLVALACKEPNKVHLAVRVPQPLVTLGIKANELIKPALTMLEGSGGGKAEHAQGAGKAVGNIQQALDQIEKNLLTS